MRQGNTSSTPAMANEWRKGERERLAMHTERVFPDLILPNMEFVIQTLYIISGIATEIFDRKS